MSAFLGNLQPFGFQAGPTVGHLLQHERGQRNCILQCRNLYCNSQVQSVRQGFIGGGAEQSRYYATEEIQGHFL